MNKFGNGKVDGLYPIQEINTPERVNYCDTGITGVVKLLFGKSDTKSSAPKIITATTEIPKDAVIDVVGKEPNDTSNNTLEHIDTPPYAAFDIELTDKGLVINWGEPTPPDSGIDSKYEGIDEGIVAGRIFIGALGAYATFTCSVNGAPGYAIASSAAASAFILATKKRKPSKSSSEHPTTPISTLPQRLAEIDASGQLDQAFIVTSRPYDIFSRADDVVEPIDSQFDMVQLASSVGVNVEGTKKQDLPRRIKELEAAQKRVNSVLTKQLNNQTSGNASNTLAHYINITESLRQLRQEQVTDAATVDIMKFRLNPAESLYTIFQTRGLDTDALVISTFEQLQTILHAQRACDSVMAEFVAIAKSNDYELLQDEAKTLALTAHEYMKTIFYAILDIKVAALRQQQEALGELL